MSSFPFHYSSYLDFVGHTARFFLDSSSLYVFEMKNLKIYSSLALTSGILNKFGFEIFNFRIKIVEHLESAAR